LVPAPSPQQKRVEGFLFWSPLQSSGQLRQSSPSAVSQIPFPQLGASRQSPGQLPQSSPASQMPLLLHGLQFDVSKSRQLATQARSPPPKPRDWQVSPARLLPSQTSLHSPWTLPSPQAPGMQSFASYVQSELQPRPAPT
jgi:hypothetical protein